MKRVLAAIMPVLCSCGTIPQLDRPVDLIFSRALPVCAVIADAQSYNGRSILIDGLYKVEPHGAIFFGSSCSGDVVRLEKAEKYTENKEAKSLLEVSMDADETKSIEVVYRAVFRIVQGLQCSDVRCFRYEIEITELVAARQAMNAQH
jgi:hypothetical protein